MKRHEYSTSCSEGVQVQTLGNWVEFIELIRNKHANCPGLIYRGQADAKWKIESSLDRLERKYPRTKNYEYRFGKPNPEEFNCPPLIRPYQLAAFQEAARGRRGPGAPDLSEDEWWALAQHHGLATPLMDWTYSPFVALFFAFEEDKCADLDGALIAPEKRAVYSTGLDIYNRIEDDADRPVAFVPTTDSNYRLVNQAGLFLKMPQGRDLETIVRENFAEESREQAEFDVPLVVLEKIEIPDDGRIECLKFLNKMNINRMSMFPDLDGAAHYVNVLWELEYDRMLGFVTLKNSSGRAH